MVWRIGNEQSIRIREDNWLPVQTNRSTLSPLHDVQPETKVSTLINQGLGIWNSSQIEQMFLPYKSTMILGILLSPRLPLNRIIWGLTLNGRYSTISAYKMLVSCASSNNAGSSNLEAQKLVWNGIWQLRTPNKIKHFVWRAYNNALPIMKNLCRRHISTSKICIGVIIRDWEGNSFRALTMTIPLSHSVVELEALACRRAAQFALEIGLREVIFEGDSALVIQAILTGSGYQSAYGNMIDDICCQAAALQFSIFYNVKRNCNLVNDALAKKAKNYTGLQVWLEDLLKTWSPKFFLMFISSVE
ncbi:hypothetical protein SO802_016039 [Lithocarpus litseifolius]|uniref:RNase H type-1 domain-containing protein n=1 Tax=Lithocarpus litseifolius TaxID=425828 RepID=A0AAW2CXU1_9ROSI